MKIVHTHFDTIDSTNSWAKRNIETFDENVITLITADEQTAGYGRFKRSWESPKGKNIYATFVWFVKEPLTYYVGQIPHLLALSLCHVLEQKGLAPLIKWPNDLLLNNKKIAGILCETTSLNDHTKTIICGVGLNVNMTHEELLKINQPATSILNESEKIESIENLLQQIIDHFVPALTLFQNHGFSPFFESFKHRFFLKLGDKISIRYNNDLLNGEFSLLNSDGSIIINLTDGTEKTIRSGECL